MSPAAYTFSPSLSFSSNHTAGCLVADIPVLAVGLLAFAVSSFFLVVKKLDLAIVFITSSALLDFFAGILDVSQILLRGGADAPSDSAVSSLSSARDVFYALATGLRFISFWAIVAQCPRGEICRKQFPQSSQNFLAIESSFHAGNWIRWGIVGILLKWGTAAFAVAIALLQILWRTIDDFDNPGAIYAAENGLEIVVSTIFIIKMLLNAAIVETATSWQTLVSYSPIMIALGLNIGLGIGNLTVFAFTESTTGRLILAISLYITIETLLIWKFHPVKGLRAKLDNDELEEKRRASSFQGLRIDSMRPLSGVDVSYSVTQRGPGHRSRLSVSGRRVSSWMIRTTSGLSGRYRPALERDEARLYNPQDAERGRSLSPTGTEQGATTAYDRSPTEPKQSARYPDPLFTSFFMDSQRDVNALKFDRSSTSPGGPAREPESDRTSTLASYYAQAATRDSEGAVPVPPPALLQPASPIFGLNGTMRGGRFSPITSATPSPVIPARSAPVLPKEPESSPAAALLTIPVATSATAIARDESSAADVEPVFVDSPVSLDPPRAPFSDAVASARSSGYEQLMREQNELEKSIAALRMFAGSSMDVYDTRDSLREPTDSSPDSNLPRNTIGTTRSSYSVGPQSASVKSEFSLSNFPEPPLVRRSSQVQPSSLPREVRFSDASGQSSADGENGKEIRGGTRESAEFELVPPRMPAALNEQSVPSSTRTSEDSVFMAPHARVDSAGTQYDVTSFIDTLSVPMHKKTPSSLAVVHKAADDESVSVMSPMSSRSAASAEIVTIARQPSNGQAARAYRVGHGTARQASLDETVPQAISTPHVIAMPPRSASVDDAGGAIKSSPRIVSPDPGLAVRRISPAQVDFARTPGGRAAGLPARPRMISSPKRQSSVDANSLLYERPRPAPPF